MINAGCLEDVTEIYCLHMQPHRPIGVFATKEGCVHASSDGFVIKVNGKNAPGAYPNKGVDAIWVSSQIVIALQGLISRETSAFQNAVLTIGKIEGGEARNIICNKVVMDGTLRSTNKEHRQKLINRINPIVNSIATANGATAEFEIIQSYISGFNNDYCTQKAIDLITFLFGKNNIQIQSNPSMGGEDFSFYQEKVSGCKLVLGTGTSENLHTSAFYVNEDTLKYGVGFYLGLIFLN